jgi:hypothetical protein
MRLQTITTSKTHDLPLYMNAMTIGLIAVTARAEGLEAGDVQIVATKKGIGFRCDLIDTILATLRSDDDILPALADGLPMSYAEVLSAGGEIFADACQTIGWSCLPAYAPAEPPISTPLGHWILQRVANGWYADLMLRTVATSQRHTRTIQAIAAAVLVTRKLSGEEIEQIITDLS